MFYSSSLPSTIEYCTGNSPTGSWDYQGGILNPADNCQTSHQAITEFKGKCYLLYHNGILPGGNSFHRSVCIEEFSLNSDGTIPLLNTTIEGVKTNVGKLNPFERVEAEKMAWSQGLVAVDDENAGVYISGINNSDYIKIRDVDFGKGAKKFVAHVSSS